MVVPFLWCQSPGDTIRLRRFHSFASDPKRATHPSPDETGGINHRDDESRRMQWGFHKHVVTQKPVEAKEHQETKKQRKADRQSLVLCMRSPVPGDCEGKTAIYQQGKQHGDEAS